MRSWKLGRAAGIDIFLHPSFLILLAFVALTQQDGLLSVSLVSAVFGCVLLHELGHSLMARRFGIDTVDITLYPIGGVARLSRMPKAPGAELLIAVAGPAVNLALALAFQVAFGLSTFLEPASTDSLGAGVLSAMITINVGLALFNLVPAFPMDGGRVLRALLSGWIGRVRATQIAADLGQALAVFFGLYSLLEGNGVQFFLAAFIFLAARMELAQVVAEHPWRRPQTPDASVRGAPPGFSWVSRGPGVWQLAPILATNDRPRSCRR